MLQLNDHLNLSSPVLWVKTGELTSLYDRVLSGLSKAKGRKIFRIHPMSGLQAWDFDSSEWRIVLLENPEGDFIPVGDFPVCLRYVYGERGTLIIPDAHLVIEDILPILNILEEEFRDSWQANSADQLPMQIVMVSAEDCPSKEIGSTAAFCELGIPTIEDLVSVTDFIICSSKMSGENLNPEAIAAAGHGLSEANYRSLITSSYMNTGSIDPAWVLEQKLASIKQNCGLDISKPAMTFDDIGGLDKIKETIQLVTWMWENPKEAEAAGVSPIRRLLMVGVPGTGKSAICEATATTLGLDLAKIGVSKALSKWIGESEQNTRAQFAILNALSPIVAWIDEFGRDFSGGGSSNDSGTTDRVHGEFLTGIQELSDDIFLMAAANNISGLAPELLRADRFDKIFFVGFPAFEERVTIFKIHLGELAGDHDLLKLADATPWWTGAEIKSLIAEAKFLSFSVDKTPPTTEQILKLAEKFKNRLWLKNRDGIIGMYRNAYDQYEWASSAQKDDATVLLSGGEIGGAKKPSNAKQKIKL
jgi:AAA+ superfamily predicted ATPase